MADKKKVLYLATFDPTVSSTGTTTRGKYFLKFFSEVFETHLVYMEDSHRDGKDESLIGNLASIESISYSSLDYFLFSRKFYIAAKKVLDKYPIDFMFADFEKSGWYAYLLSQKYSIPYVYNSHNVEFLRYIDFAKRNLLRYPFVPYMYFVEKKACKNALFTIAISEKDAGTFRRWASREKVLVMPCTFDEFIFTPFYEEVKTSVPVVLMVGNYRNPGNREGAYLLHKKIMPTVLKKYPETIFRCIGRDFPDDIQHPSIEVLGFVDDLMDEYKKATLVIVPITIGGGIKIKTIEGLACGRFVISTPKGVEGIDISGLDHLKVLSIEEFSDCIINAIFNRVGKVTRNWDKLVKAYGTRHQLSLIKENLELIVNTGKALVQDE